MIQKISKIGNSYVVVIPEEIVERLDLHAGDVVTFEIRKADWQGDMNPDVQAALERSLDAYEEDYEHLGTN